MRSIFVVIMAVLQFDVAAQPQADGPSLAARVARAREDLAAAFSGEKLVEGRFVERSTNEYVFVPTRAALPQAPVTNPESVSAFAIGPLLNVKGTLDSNGNLQVGKYSVSRTSVWLSASLPSEVKGATADILKVLDFAVQPGAMSAAPRDAGASNQVAKDTRDEIAKIRNSYVELVRNGAEATKIHEVVKTWASLRDKISDTFPDSDNLKAFYGSADNYDPWRYNHIFNQSPAVIALARPGSSTAECSGVLITDDLILTAAHCFGTKNFIQPTQMEVWFHHIRYPPGVNGEAMLRRGVAELVAPPVERLKDILSGKFDDTLYDYAILRLKAPSCTEEEKAAGKCPPITPKNAIPQCVTERVVYKNDPVYVIGYPQGQEEMVHDSARVYLPYAVYGDDELYELRLNTDADLLDVKDRVDLMKDFDNSYQAGTDPGTGLAMYYFRHIREAGQPRMGIVADTFKGNSGGPVYDREFKQCVVGILIKGQTDTGKRRTATWQEHERVLPMSAIIENLKKTRPEVAARLKVEQ